MSSQGLAQSNSAHSSSSATSSGSDVNVSGRLFILTGATGAIGGAIARELAAVPNSSLLLPVRSAADGEALVLALKKHVGEVQGSAAAAAANIFYESVDLASKASVRAFAVIVGKKYGGKVHVLLNNAGVSGLQRRVSVDGFELQFHVNVLAYYQLMKLLEPYLAAASTPKQLSRVVNVSSTYVGDLDVNDLLFTRRAYDCQSVYRQTKLCDRLITYALAPSFLQRGITVNCCNPAFVTSKLLRDAGIERGYNTAEEGAATPVYLATSAAVEGKTAGFYDQKQPANCRYQQDAESIATLWKQCEEWSQ